MSLGPPNQKIRTSVWRFTVLFTFLVFLISSSLLFLVYHFTIGEQQRQKTQQVLLTAQSLIDLANAPHIKKADYERVIVNRGKQSASLILALESEGKYQGNLTAVPDGLSIYPDLDYFPIAVIDAAGQRSIAMVLGSQQETPFGNMVVGVIDEEYLVRDVAFFSASGGGLLFCLLITMVTGFFFNRSVLYRVEQIARLSADVRAGNREARLPLSKRNDEFDAIAYQINLMLEDIDELIGSVASVTDNIAHDLRTPLSRLRISIEESLSKGAGDQLQKQRNVELIEELDDVIETFNAMLELSRLESGVDQTKFKRVDLRTLCIDAVDLASALAEEKNQDLSFELPETETDMYVSCEPSLMFRAIFNVLENAVKYSPERGAICLNISRAGELIEVTISDNGPGIPQHLQDQVFRRLCRLESSRQSKGHGLGLSIVKAIMELHGGSVNLSQGKTQGLSVTLKLPKVIFS